MQGPAVAGMAEVVTVHMEFLEEGASDRELVAAATHDGGQEAVDMSARVAVANNGWMAMVATTVVSVLHEAVEVENGRAVVEENVEMNVEVVGVGSYGSNGWVESMAEVEVSKLGVEGETPVAAAVVGKMESKPVAKEMVEVMSETAVEALSKRVREASKRAAMAEVAGVVKKLAEVAM